MEREAEALAAQIRASSKYADISFDTVLRMAEMLLPRYKNRKEAEKAVKKQLHIIHGAFFPEKCHAKAMEWMGDNTLDGKQLSLALMELHPSTRERLPFLAAFYTLLAPYIRGADTVLDIGCGFHPCAFPFMGLKEGVTYLAGDIDHGTVEVVSAFLERLHVKHEASILDAATKTEMAAADVAFLFKLIPVLEQQQKGLAYRLMENLSAGTMVVTFPVRSLSGRDKDMERFYAGQFEANLPDAMTVRCKEVVGTELVYVVTKDVL